MGSRLGTVLALLAAVVAAGSPGAARAQCSGSASVSLTDGAGVVWDVRLDGAILNGSSDAFDGGMVLSIDGAYFTAVGVGTTELGGRQVVHGPQTMSGLAVTRRVLVPAGEGWARFLEYLDNPTAAPITVTVRIETNPGSDSSTIVTSSASGDTIFTTADRWVATDDSSTSGGDPSLCHAYWGPGARSLPSAVGMTVFDCASSNGVSSTFPVTVPAGGRAIVMHFGSQSGTATDAMTSCASLSALPASTIADLSASDRAAIVNWAVGGMPSDGGVPDAGPPDAGSRDSGILRDAGPTDAGSGRDSSVPRLDAGPLPDGSVRPDSGLTLRDAGLRPRIRTRDRGCCSTVPDPGDRTAGAVAFGALAVLVLLRRARRRRRR